MQRFKLFKSLTSQVDFFRNEVTSLAQQVEKLEQKIIHLEARVEHNSKDLFSDTLNAPNDIKITQQGNNYTPIGKKALYLTQNDPKRSAVLSEVRNTTSKTKDIQSKTSSNAPRSPLKPLSRSQQYNLSSNQNKTLNMMDY